MRPVLVVGFAVIFGLWLVSVYELIRRIADVEAQATTIATRFNQGDEVLHNVRAQVSLSAIYVRDVALDTRPDATSFYREQLQAARADIDRALEQYVPDVGSGAEREHWSELEKELQDYWTSVAPALTGQLPADRAAAQALLRRDVIPRRQQIVSISDDLRTLNRDAFQQQQAEVAELHQVLRQRIWWTSSIAVAFGLAIAFFAARYAARLEWRIRQQHLQERQHKRDLQRLSAELVHAQEDERRKIGRDLHDEIGQALMTIRLDLGVVERSGHVTGAAAEALAEARATNDHAIQSVRDLSQLLHPAMLDDFGLPVTLDAYLRRFSQRTGVRTELVQDGMDGRLASEVEVCVYRVTQEALTNVAKHAQASSCRIYLQRLPYSLLVTIEDDGVGMTPERLEHPEDRHGVGLVGVRERIARLSGTFHLETNVGKGTRLTIELPVSADATVQETSAPASTPSPAWSGERG
jgi:signal transduction histidine kinase